MCHLFSKITPKVWLGLLCSFVTAKGSFEVWERLEICSKAAKCKISPIRFQEILRYFAMWHCLQHSSVPLYHCYLYHTKLTSTDKAAFKEKNKTERCFSLLNQQKPHLTNCRHQTVSIFMRASHIYTNDGPRLKELFCSALMAPTDPSTRFTQTH